ncbi:MAG: DUF4167 domain-containing protein, partial [Alphaproteobacteria bacterium]|nr:DUF4167 domain-containing protein [Alphaproteobacteria bacterium]
AGDRVMTEYYLQFADHYFRVVSEMRARYEDQQPQPRRNRDEWDSADFDADGESEKSAARPHAFTSGHEDDDSDEPEIDVRRAERPAQGARQHAAPQDEDETNAKPRPSRRSAFERIRNEAAAIPVEESPTAQTVQHGLPLDALPPAIGLAAAGAELADEAQVEVVAAPKKRGRARKVATTAEAA